MIASRTDNKIPANPKWIANKLGASTKVDIDQLVRSGFLEYTDASNTIADRSDNCTVTAPLEEERRGETEKSREEKSGRFAPPDFQEVYEYCLERKNGIDADYFIDYYQTRDWKLKGGQKMKDWKSAIRTWEKNKNSTNEPIVDRISDRSWAN
jgi:hypothetical protein